MRRTPSLPVLFILLAALMAIALAAGLTWMRLNAADTPAGATRVGGEVGVAAGVTIGGPYELTAHDGSRMGSEDFQGEFQLIYFGFTYCPDVCPTELASVANALDRMGEKAARVRPLFITVDPERDDPATMAEYVRHFHPRLVGLTGSPDEIGAVLKSFRVFARKVESQTSNQYVMDHSTFLYLMGPDGEFVTMFRYGTDPEEMARAIATHVDAAS